MPRLTILLLSLMLGAGSAVLVSCGGEDGPDGPGIPSEAADDMIIELGRARAAFEAGDCVKVQDSAADIAANAQNLATNAEPPLDPEIADGIEQGAARLAELAQDPVQCEQTTTTNTEDEDKEETTEPTTTTPTTTEETTTTTTTEEPPPEEDGEDGDEGTDGGPPPQPPGHEPGPGPGTGGVGDGE